MADVSFADRLSRMSTAWTMVFQAHRGTGDTARAAAQQALIQRYCGVVYRYLLGATRDPDVADELAQEFALAFVQGNFKRADPQRGRFRDYIKTILFNLIRKYHQRKKRQPHQLSPEAAEPAAPEESHAEDEEFLKGWREELLARTWEALTRVQAQTGQPFHAILWFRAQNPGVSSGEMAERLGKELGRSLTAAGVRQTLHRARERFADLLLDEVARSLESGDHEALEQELIELNLLAYCKDGLQRRQG
jgi:RNA polymerase sigma-70 factor (ECF subfamily)